MNLCRRGINRSYFPAVAGLLLFSRIAAAQLAITEMMSAHFSPTDFFELTNFGTNIVSLNGYIFIDADHRSAREPLVETNESVALGPGESIVYFRLWTNRTEGDFRAFWGTCLDSNVRIHPYPKPGFSSFGDSLTIYDPLNQMVDKVEFGRADRPISFVYNPNTGVFDTRSTPANGACLSVTNDNLASPGRTTGPVPLEIKQQPSDVTACQGLEASFTVEAIGMPRPRFQWLFNGLAISGQQDQTLIIPNVTARVEGAYSVRVFNGLSNILSSPAILALNTYAGAPTLVAAPADSTVVEGRTARFAIGVCAYPPPTYQWFQNGLPLVNETNRVLFIRGASGGISDGVFCVRAENQFGSVEACATLSVTNISPIRITEVQANPAPGCDGHNDWFEITNFGRNDVQLLGYRFSDRPVLSDAQVVNRPVLLKAHESAIFVKNSSVGTFFDWWGADQLPPDLQVIPYSGFSLGGDGDALYLWSDTAEDPNELLDSIAFAHNSPGRTINFEVNGAPRESDETRDQVIKAVECGDIGNPGFAQALRPKFTSIKILPGVEVSFFWRGSSGMFYMLQFAEHLAGPWSDLWRSEYMGTDFPVAYTDLITTNTPTRFYRLLPVESR